MLDESAISGLLKEHAYSKRRRIYSKEDLEARTFHLFNECEYSVCTLLNSTPSPHLLPQSVGMSQLVPEINVCDSGFQYEGFVHFKRTHYMETYRELVRVHDKTPSLEPPQPDKSEWKKEHKVAYENMEMLVNSFFHGSEIILQEKNTTEYRMRRYRLMAESHGVELTSLLETIYYSEPTIMDWLIDATMTYYTDYQLRSYVELLTIVLPNNLHLTNMLKFDPTADWFSGVYRRKVFGTKIGELYRKLTVIWVPAVESASNSKNELENKTKNEPDSEAAPSTTPPEEIVQVDAANQDITLLIVPPLPCFMLEEGDGSSAMSESNFVQSERVGIFSKYFKNAQILDYKIKPLDQKDFNDDMIQWWLNDLACVIQRRIALFRKVEPLAQLYVVGWLTGASLAYKVFLALLEQINGVVLINMPTNNGSLGTDKNLDTRLLYKSNRPIIFVASSESQLSNLNELREIRASMSHQSSLVYVHYCDDFLQMKSQTKKRLILTQDIVDASVVESIRARIVHEINSVTAITTSKLLAASKKAAAHPKNTAANQPSNSASSRKSQSDANTQVPHLKSTTVPTAAPSTGSNNNTSSFLNAINHLKSASLNYNNPAMSFILANSARKLANMTQPKVSSSNMSNPSFGHLPNSGISTPVKPLSQSHQDQSDQKSFIHPPSK